MKKRHNPDIPSAGHDLQYADVTAGQGVRTERAENKLTMAFMFNVIMLLLNSALYFNSKSMKIRPYPGIIALLIILVATGCNQKAGNSEKSGTPGKANDTMAAAEAVMNDPGIPAGNEGIPFKAKMDTKRFHQAALDGDLSTVKEGIASGLETDVTDAEHHTALMLAAYNGHTGIVDFLLKEGAQPDITDNMNRTALMYASTGPFRETVLALLQAGADPDMTDSVEHFTALMFAAAEGQTAVVKALLEHGADQGMKDIDGEGAYDFAVANGHSVTAALLK